MLTCPLHVQACQIADMLTSNSRIEEPNTRHVCTYLNAIFMMIPNTINLKYFDIFEHIMFNLFELSSVHIVSVIKFKRYLSVVLWVDYPEVHPIQHVIPYGGDGHP